MFHNMLEFRKQICFESWSMGELIYIDGYITNRENDDEVATFVIYANKKGKMVYKEFKPKDWMKRSKLEEKLSTEAYSK